MDFNNIKITNTNKSKNKTKRLIIEEYTTSEPLYRPSEVIALYTEPKDKRTYKNLTIILEPTALKLTTFETVKKALLEMIKNNNGGFTDIGGNKKLFYATLEPTASLINKKLIKE